MVTMPSSDPRTRPLAAIESDLAAAEARAAALTPDSTTSALITAYADLSDLKWELRRAHFLLDPRPGDPDYTPPIPT